MALVISNFSDVLNVESGLEISDFNLIPILFNKLFLKDLINNERID